MTVRLSAPNQTEPAPMFLETQKPTPQQGESVVAIVQAPNQVVARGASEVESLLAMREHDLTLDLRTTNRIDVRGLVTLLDRHKSLESAGFELQLLCADGPVLDLLEGLEIHRTITILRDPSEIVSSCKATGASSQGSGH